MIGWKQTIHSMFTLSNVNAMSGAEFIRAFGEVYEHSSWAAEFTETQRPFSNTHELVQSFRDIVSRATLEKQDVLIRSHPELAGRPARERRLTRASTREQARLGLDQLSDEEYAEFDELNRNYRQKFDFPFIICLGLLTDKSQVLDAFRKRIHHTMEEERVEALEQIHHIARVRLRGLIADLNV